MAIPPVATVPSSVLRHAAQGENWEDAAEKLEIKHRWVGLQINKQNLSSLWVLLIEITLYVDGRLDNGQRDVYLLS